LVSGTSLAASAGDSLDPVELAPGHVVRSKEVIAAAARDLAQHEQWLKAHLAAEERSRRRYARGVRREAARERRRSNHQRLARSGTRIVLTVARSSRAIRRSLLEEAAYSFGQLRRYTLLTAAWGVPKAHAVSSWTFEEISGALSWSGAKARALTLTSVRVASIGLSRGIAGARALASVARRATSSAAAASAAKGRALANIVGATASTGFAWTRARSRSLARASREKAAIGGSWLATRVSALAAASAKATSKRHVLEHRREPRPCAQLQSGNRGRCRQDCREDARSRVGLGGSGGKRRVLDRGEEPWLRLPVASGGCNRRRLGCCQGSHRRAQFA
jgi:hypothetical protein